MRHAQGVWTSNDESFYKDEWVDNLFEGFGVCIL